MMTTDKFWTLIDAAREAAEDDLEAYAVSLRQARLPLSPDALVSFDTLFDQFLSQAYDWKLWGAAYLINGGCSDDGFIYFRAWLIMQGKDVYERALAEPDS